MPFKNITAIKQIVLGEGVPENMRGAAHPLHPDLPPVSPEHLLYTAFGKGYAVLA